MSASAIGFMLIVLVGVAATVIWTIMAKPKVVQNRIALSLNEVYREHYQRSGIPYEVVDYAFGLIARAFNIKAGQLRPADRFADELRIAGGWDAYDSPLHELSDELRIELSDQELAGIKTVDDVVRSIAAARRPHN